MRPYPYIYAPDFLTHERLIVGLHELGLLASGRDLDEEVIRWRRIMRVGDGSNVSHPYFFWRHDFSGWFDAFRTISSDNTAYTKVNSVNHFLDYAKRSARDKS